MERCPDCGSDVHGAQVCGRCGAFDFEGVTSWVCFPCGAQNAHGETRCACGRERTVECGACGEDVPFASERCPKCGVPRFAFAAAEEAQRISSAALKLHEGALRLGLLFTPVALLGLVLLLGGSLGRRVGGGALLALGLSGDAYALVLHRRARRAVE